MTTPFLQLLKTKTLVSSLFCHIWHPINQQILLTLRQDSIQNLTLMSSLLRKWSLLFYPWPPVQILLHSGQSHLSTLKTLGWVLLKSKRQSHIVLFSVYLPVLPYKKRWWGQEFVLFADTVPVSRRMNGTYWERSTCWISVLIMGNDALLTYLYTHCSFLVLPANLNDQGTPTKGRKGKNWLFFTAVCSLGNAL